MKTHWKQLVNPDYLGAYSLPDGQDLTITIDHVKRDEITTQGGKKEECTIAVLKDQKPFILNVTNQKTIAKVLGSPYIEDWQGKQITVFASTTKLAGELVECLRVRPQPPSKPSLSDQRFNGAIQAIKDGKYTVDQLINTYSLTNDQRIKLNGLAN